MIMNTTPFSPAHKKEADIEHTVIFFLLHVFGGGPSGFYLRDVQFCPYCPNVAEISVWSSFFLNSFVRCFSGSFSVAWLSHVLR